MDEHLGYEKNVITNSSNSRNGHSSKNVKGLFGETRIRTHMIGVKVLILF